MPDSASISTGILLTLAAALLVALMLYPSSLVRWLQRKRYQYEVTFSLYMLTSTEKFILSTHYSPNTNTFPKTPNTVPPLSLHRLCTHLTNPSSHAPC
jgi:hypothetical protein